MRYSPFALAVLLCWSTVTPALASDRSADRAEASETSATVPSMMSKIEEGAPPIESDGATKRNSSPAALSLYDAVKRSGLLKEADCRIIEAAVELNPKLLDTSANRAFASQTEDGLLSSKPAMLAYISDLLARSRAQALLSRVVPVKDDARERLKSTFEAIDRPDLTISRLTTAEVQGADAALKSHLFVLKPICPSGVLAAIAAAGRCIHDNPWTRSLFYSVVPVSLDGRQICTGTAIAPHLILTAAHCVIDQSGATRSVVEPGRVRVAGRQGNGIGLSGSPRVPQQMLIGDCLPDCYDMRFDFAILETDAGMDGGWTPIPVLTKLKSPGNVEITIAGYGISTLPASQASQGLFIGEQRLRLTATADSFRWGYGFPGDVLSSSCDGDSGGPIFYGKPRKDGDSLVLIGVISRIEEGTCYKTHAVAVNLSMPEPAKEFCALIKAVLRFCDS